MSWGIILAATVIVILMFLYEWPKMKQHSKKEKTAFVVIAAIGWVLAILLVVFPDMKGPTQWVDALYKPLGKLLE
ncbi:hypothetical protein [Paenibacillus sp. UNC451MF]|uniref:hypothetical protein n=1 Tax=Paenibacillus sp. UNC451MF TaxID=1449063 RepID=UPI00048B9FCC|nr:hypothetical protein [Paenibacillus sp. UNC451MF]